MLMSFHNTFRCRMTFGEFKYQPIEIYRYPADKQADSTQSMEFGNFIMENSEVKRVHFE